MRHRWWSGLMIVGLSTWLVAPLAVASHDGKEHGGKEHGGKEHGGQAPVRIEPTASQIRQAIQDHVQGIIQRQGAFTIRDQQTGTQRSLSLVRVHERVGKTGDLYYSCTDMRDEATGQLLDLDFDVDAESGSLQVVETRIHKVDGQARYTYDEQDRRIPVATR